MSLLMDVLRKLQFQRRRPRVHPVLLKKKDTGSRRLLILLIAGVFLLSTGIAYYLTNIVASRITAGVPAPVVQRPTDTTPPPRTSEPEQEPNPRPEPREESTPPTELKEIRTVKVEPREEVKKITEDMEEKQERPKPMPARVITLEDPTTYLVMADRYFREGNLIKSREYYEKTYSLMKTQKVANNLIVVCVRLGDLACAERVIEENPQENLVYTYLMELSRVGRPAEVIELAKKYTHLDKKGALSFALGYAYEKLGDYAKALRNYKTAYAKDPYNPYFAYNYARLLDYTRSYREAYRIYSSLKNLDIDPRIKRSVEERLKLLRFLGFGE